MYRIIRSYEVIGHDGLCRLAGYYQQGTPALAIRLLPERIPSLAEIGAPKAWQKMKALEQGLILVTGRTGAGKTTTLAAFIEALNQEKSYHIITLEKINTKDMIQMYEVSRSLIILGTLGVNFFCL
ncbi:ATPase, T2SS/T4P/T4SS family [Selenomonas sp. ND2010]|uniref:ATPase, T2SS/T4P/T4SS family n=1 Tax=Selenomonas sp. ND2010 TaxID=1410618 RepID=UPI00051C6962|nr:ATPase, T2SS/T4P/T4SS family [Selenomonas sp. ND2010]